MPQVLKRSIENCQGSYFHIDFINNSVICFFILLYERLVTVSLFRLAQFCNYLLLSLFEVGKFVLKRLTHLLFVFNLVSQKWNSFLATSIRGSRSLGRWHWRLLDESSLQHDSGRINRDTLLDQNLLNRILVNLFIQFLFDKVLVVVYDLLHVTILVLA